MEVNFLQGGAAISAPPADSSVSAQLTASRAERSESLYNRIVRWLVYATAVLVPLAYLPWTSSPLEANKQLILVVLMSVALVTWLLGAVVSGRLTIRTTPVDKGVYAVALATVVATVVSVARAKSVFGLSASSSSSLLTVLALAAFYFLAVNVLHDRGRGLRQVFAASAALALIGGLLNLFGVSVLPGVTSRAFNTVGSLNALGIVAAVMLPVFAKLGSRGRASVFLSVAGVVLSVLTLAVLNWWVLWVVALVGMLAMIAFDSLNVTQLAEDYGGRRNRFALSRFVIPMTVIVVGAFLLLVGFSPDSLRSGIPVEVAPSYQLTWQVVTGVMGDNLLTGWGPENFSLAFDRFGARDLANSRLASWKFFDGAGEIFSTVVHTGAIGLLALVLLVWCLVQVVARFGAAISESVTRGDGAAFAAESSGTLAAAVALGAAVFLYPFSLALAFGGTILLALAGLIVAGDRQRTVDIEERPLYSLTASMGFIVGLIVVLTGIYFTSVRYLADVRYARAAAMKTPEDAMTGLVRAIDLNPSNDQYLRDASQLALALLRSEVAKKDDDAQRPQRIQNLVASSIQLAQRAAQVAPKESLNWENLGLVYQAMTGLVDNVEQLAQDAFAKAGELRPGDPTFDNRTGQMWLARADLIRQVARGSTAAQLQEQYTQSLTRAEESFKKAIEKAPAFGLAIYNLGAVYDRQGKVDDAISQLERIAPYNANEPTLMFELGLLYIRDNRLDAATGAMRRAVLLAPQYANARWYLALLLEESGDRAGALEQLKEIQKSNADNEALKEKIAQLEAVPPVPAEGEVIDNPPLQ